MLRVEFEPTTLVFERAKTSHILDRAATAISYTWVVNEFNNIKKKYNTE
jgi:hypothetical protein